MQFFKCSPIFLLLGLISVTFAQDVQPELTNNLNLRNSQGISNLSSNDVPTRNLRSRKASGRQLQQDRASIDFTAAQRLWQSKAIYNYGYTFIYRGSNPQNAMYPWTVTVRNGSQVTANDANNNPIYYKDPSPQTIDDIFQRIHKAIGEGVHTVQVQYNSQYGYPENVNIVYNDSNPQQTTWGPAQLTGFILE